VDIAAAKQTVADYANFAANPASVVSPWVRKLAQRYLKEVEDQDKSEFYFDEAAAFHPIRFFSLLQFSEGSWKDKPFELLPWQTFVVWNVYGWKRRKNGRRRYRKVYIKVARKNGKTEFLSALGMYGQMSDPSEKGAQVFWFATKKDQAVIGFNRQKVMTELLCQKSAKVAAMVRVMQYRIIDRAGTGFTTYLGQDSKGEDGHNPFYGLCDEYHAHINNGMMNVISSGQRSRKDPMIWIITTAGTNPEGPCAKYEKMCKQVLDGIVENDSVFPMIFDLDEGDDWEDPKVWGKANPALGHSLELDELIEAYKEAKAEGIESIMNFQTKCLNMWLKANVTWLPADEWKANKGDLSRREIMQAMKGRTCFGGLDLGTTNDLSSYVLTFPPMLASEPWHVLHWSWCPEDSFEKRVKLDGAPYLQFVENGELELTPGNVTDYNWIKKKVVETVSDYDVHSIAFDSNKAHKLVPELVDEGIKMEGFSQRFLQMSVPTTDVETMVKVEWRRAEQVKRGEEPDGDTRGFAHGGDELLAWAISNVTLARNQDGLVKPDKSKSSEKIDPCVALIMAVGQANHYLTEMKANEGYNPVTIISI